MSELHFNITGNSSNLKRALQDVERGVAHTTQVLASKGTSIDALFSNMSKGAQRAGEDIRDNIQQGADKALSSVNNLIDSLSKPITATLQIAGLGAIGALMEKIASVRGEFQQMESQINTLVGDRMGSKLMEQLTDFAKVSPLGFKDTVNRAQMMLGFDIDAEKVPRFLSAIGDIAMGDSQRFSSLTLAFSQMSATGKLMGQDLMQMVNAGFQPLNQLAKDTGKSIAQLKDEMSDGKISAEMVQQAFINATDAGGQFYNMSANANKTIPGQASQLGDAIDLMFNEIGEGGQDAIMKVIEGATWIVDHYQEVATVLGSVVAGYGAYKACLMVNEYAVKSLAAAEAQQAETEIMHSAQVVAGLQAELDKLRELNDERSRMIPWRDSDLTTAVNNGEIDEGMAAAIQQQRDLWKQKNDEAQRGVEIANQNLTLALAEGEAARKSRMEIEKKLSPLEEDVRIQQAVVDSLDARIDKQREYVDMLKELNSDGGYDAQIDQERAELAELMAKRKAEAERLATMAQEQSSMATELDTAVEREHAAVRSISNAQTELSTANTRAHTLARRAEAVATTTDTAAETASTAATKRSTLAKIADVVQTKLSTAAHKVHIAVVTAAKNAVNGLKAAIMTNPIGMLVGALSMAAGAFMAFRDEAEESSEAVTKFGESGAKTFKDVGTLYAVVNSVSESSNIYKKSLKDLTDIAKEYGLTITEEGNVLQQLNDKRQQLITLIQEEGRQRQIANNIESLQKPLEAERDAVSDKIKEMLKDELPESGKEHAALYSQTIAESIQANSESIIQLLDREEELIAEKRKGASIKRLAEIGRERAEIRAKISELAYGDAQEMANNLGDSISFSSSMKRWDMVERMEQFAKKTQDTNRQLEVYTANLNESKKAQEAAADKTPIDLQKMSLDELLKSMDEADKKAIAPKVDTTGVDKAKGSTEDAKAALDEANDTVVSPKADSSKIEKLEQKAADAKGGLDVLGNMSVTPDVKTSKLDEFQRKANEAYITLSMLAGIKNPMPLFNKDGNAQQGWFASDSLKSENQVYPELTLEQKKADILRRIKDADTTQAYKELRSKIAAKMESLSQNDPMWDWYNKRLEDIDKKDKSKKNTKSSKDDPKARAYALDKLQAEREEQEARKLRKAREEASDLDIEQRTVSTDKEIAAIKNNAAKKRAALEDSLKDEIKRLKQSDIKEWMQGGKDRKEYQWELQGRTSEQTDEYYRQRAMQMIGYSTQFQKIAYDENKAVDEARKEELSAMRSYLAEYGSYEEQRLAIAQEYAEKIAKAKTQGEKLTLAKERDEKVQGVETKAITQQIDWYGVFGNLGGIFRSQLEDMYSKLDKYSRTKEFAQSGADNQKAVVEAMEKIRETMGGGTTLGWEDLASAIAVYQQKLQELEVAKTNEKSAINQVNAAQKKLQDAIASGSQSEIDAANMQLSAANSLRDGYSKNVVTLTNDVEAAGKNLSRTSMEVTQSVSEFTTFFSQAGLTQFASLFGAIDQLKGGIAGLKGLKKSADAVGELGDKAAKTSDKIDGVGGEVNKGLSKILGESGGFIAQIISAVLSILDILKDGVGTLISSLLDSVFGAISGILNNLLSGEMFKQIGTSLYEGVTGIFESIFSLGGTLGSWWKPSGNAKETAEKMEKLETSAKTLTSSIDALREEMKKTSGSKSINTAVQALEKQQELIDNYRQQLDTEMRYTGAHHSNYYRWGELNDIDWNWINTLLSEYARKNGKDAKQVWSAEDMVWQLTPEEMDYIRQHDRAFWDWMVSQGHYDKSGWWNQFADQAGTLQEISDEMRDAMTSISFDSLRSDFVSALMDMDKDAEDFSKDFEKYMMEAMLNSILSDELQDRLEDFYHRWGEMSLDSAGRAYELTEDEMESLRKEWDAIVDDGIKMRDSLAAVTGYDKTSSKYSQTASRGGFTEMNEDTAQELNGRFTALCESNERIAQSVADSFGAMTEMNVSLTSFNGHLEMLVQQHIIINEHLEIMSKQTKELPAISQQISKIAQKIQIL